MGSNSSQRSQARPRSLLPSPRCRPLSTHTQAGMASGHSSSSMAGMQATRLRSSSNSGIGNTARLRPGTIQRAMALFRQHPVSTPLLLNTPVLCLQASSSMASHHAAASAAAGPAAGGPATALLIRSWPYGSARNWHW